MPLNKRWLKDHKEKNEKANNGYITSYADYRNNSSHNVPGSIKTKFEAIANFHYNYNQVEPTFNFIDTLIKTQSRLTGDNIYIYITCIFFYRWGHYGY